MRRWNVLIVKTTDDPVVFDSRTHTVSGETAQQAMKAIVDLTTNNARVTHVTINEVRL